MVSRRWLLPLAMLGGVLLYRAVGHGYGKRLSRNLEEFSGAVPALYDASLGRAIDWYYVRVAREMARLVSSGSVLDAGCGPGRLAVHLARMAPDLAVTGLDVSPEMIELAARRAVESGLAHRVGFEVGDVGAMPFRDEQFDLVVSTFSMHHWPEPVRGMAEIHRVLKPGGTACIYDLADWALEATHHGAGFPSSRAAAIFGSEPEKSAWKLGPVPVVVRYCLRKAEKAS